MASRQPTTRDCDARTFLEPALDELALPAHVEREVQSRLEDGAYVEALVVAIYFE